MAIVAPVMREIGTSDEDRAAAFYRDVLGFEIARVDGAMEAVSGPARIRFGRQDYSPLDWTDARSTGSAMLFFETDDIDGLHAFIAQRGGTPSAVEKVNWIKMKMFAVRDPDGHTLWFGQAYNLPCGERLPPMVEKALPELPLNDVAAGVAHYRDVLGFSVNYQQHDLGVMDRDDATVLLIQRTGRHKGIGSAYFYIASADRLYAEFTAKGANVQSPPVSHPWGLRDFLVIDLEGNELRFGQPFE